MLLATSLIISIPVRFTHLYIYSLWHAAGHQLEPALAGSLMIQHPAQSYLLVHWRCTFGWVSLLMFISRLFDHEMERIRIRGCLF